MAPNLTDIRSSKDEDTSSETQLPDGQECLDDAPDDKITPRDVERRLTNLVRKLSAQSQQSHHSCIFSADENSSLNPQSPSFNARKWARAFYNARYLQDNGHPPGVAGVAFKNLNVFGYGSPVDYQMSVGNALLKVPTMIRQALGGGKQRVDILRDVEGLVLPGEQLCVLGPPGSDCSTFLRTIAGETHGLNVDSAACL